MKDLLFDFGCEDNCIVRRPNVWDFRLVQGSAHSYDIRRGLSRDGGGMFVSMRSNASCLFRPGTVGSSVLVWFFGESFNEALDRSWVN